MFCVIYNLSDIKIYMKNLSIILLLLIVSLKSFASTTYECTWLESENHRDGFFQKNSKLIFSVNKEDESFLISKDSNFLDRAYEPCPNGRNEICAFYFGHESDLAWDMSFSHSENKYLVSQIYGYGFQAWLEIDLNEDSSKAKVMGNDGDGVYFEEAFACIF